MGEPGETAAGGEPTAPLQLPDERAHASDAPTDPGVTPAPPTQQLPAQPGPPPGQPIQQPTHQPGQPWQPASPGSQPGQHQTWGAAPQAGGWGATGWTPAPAAPSGGRGKGLVIAIVAAVLVLVLGGGLLTWALMSGDGGDEQAGDDDRSSQSDDPTDEESRDAPTDEESEEEPTDEESEDGGEGCPPGDPATPNRIVGGRVISGEASFAAPAGFAPSANKVQFEWLHEVSGVDKVVESYPDQGTGWISMAVIGQVPTADYSSPQQVAESLVACMAASPRMYQGYTGDEQVSSAATTVAGQEGWKVVQEIRIDDDVIKAEGDRAVVVVLETGGDSYTVFAAVSPIGDAALAAVVDQAAASIQVG